MDQKTFGSIQLCEITDNNISNMLTEYQQRGIFLARVVDTDKKGRLQLSARESVTNDESWKMISPEGSSAHFQQMDGEAQSKGNMRNKILKFGSKVALKLGDLAHGYVTGLSKAGCFV
jgi:predicted RNA-binding protein with RPS1 domain